jgi:hypothetical protein
MDLHRRVQVGTRVVVLPGRPPKGGVGAGPGHAARPWYAAAQMNGKIKSPGRPSSGLGLSPSRLRGTASQDAVPGITSWIKGRRSVDRFKVLEW